MARATTLQAAERPTSVTQWTLHAIALPFLRAGHLGLAGLPFLLFAGVAWRLEVFYAFVGPLSLVTLTVPALQEFGRQTEVMAGPAGIAWFVGLLALGFWFCAWQRAVATGFREPIGAWLGASFRRMPQYLVCYGVWAALAFIVFALANALYSQNLWLANFPVIRPNGLPEAQAPRAIVVGLLLVLYVFVRFAPLTGLVASAWSGTLEEATRVTWSGLGLRLILAFIALLVLGWALGVGSRNLSALIAGAAWPSYAFYFTRFLALLTQIWLVTLAALSASALRPRQNDA